MATACVLVPLACRAGGRGAGARELRIFHAAGLTPLLDSLRDGCRQDLGIRLRTEASGSQMAARKLSELGRPCDLIMLADAALVGEMLAGRCSWRIDFANDALVLGVGTRAPGVDKAESDWVGALLDGNPRLARVDENLAPIGCSTLLAWKLQERQGRPGLCEKLLARTDKVVDDAAQLAALLKSGEVDYAFVYRSICIASDIRYIELDDAVNLGSPDVDYGVVSVTFATLGAGRRNVTVRGRPITWTLSIPDQDADGDLAARFLEYLLKDKPQLLAKHGLRPMARPRFFGPRSRFDAYSKLAGYAGPLE